MNHMYAYSRDDREIKFRTVSAQHFINEVPELRCSLLDYRQQRESTQFCPAAEIWGVSLNSQDVFAELKVEYFNRVFVP